jgi:secondary thiamine-phosphate synthase enzyme
MPRQEALTYRTRGRGALALTRDIARVVAESGVRTGLCNVFLQHTSASLLLTENADPAVLQDLETILARLAPDGDRAYLHDTEGSDDMAAHARAVLTTNSLALPVSEGRLALGTWQGVFLWEHRHAPHTRRVIVTVVGE